jgi:uncharacterized membrane protein
VFRNFDRQTCVRVLFVCCLVLCAISAWAQDSPAATVGASEDDAERNQWIFFLGRFHPVILHFPIALLVVLFLAEIITLGSGPGGETSAAKWLLLIVGSVTSVVAATFGWFLAWSAEYDPGLIFWHRWTGVAVAVLTVMATGLKLGYNRLDTGKYRLAYWVVLLAALGVLVPASHYGASITHGKNYLTKYLPDDLAFLEPYLGELSVEQEPIDASGYFANHIVPILEAKCFECHNVDAKQEGDYAMNDEQWLFEGGESELAAIVPGDAMASNLVTLILLPEEHEAVMPPEGKARLTSDEIIAIIHWINRGAPLGDFDPAAMEEVEVEAAEEPPQAAPAAPVETSAEGGGVEPIITVDEMMDVLFDPLMEQTRAALVEEPSGRRALQAVYNPAAALAEAHNLLFDRTDEDYMSTPEWPGLTASGRTAAKALADSVMGLDYAAMKSSFAALAKSCNDCHTQFDDELDVVDDTIPEPAAANV